MSDSADLTPDIMAALRSNSAGQKRIVTVSESRAALIEAQKALTCAKRKIDEVLSKS